MGKVLGFFKKPLNQAALVGLGGVALAWLSGQATWQVTAITAAGAIVAWLLPDNSVAKQDIETLIGDAIKVATDLANKPVAK